MKIYLGSDHAGFELKNKIKKYLEGLGEDVFDKGGTEFNKDDDYPDFIAPVARAVSEDGSAKGIILGGSGQGEAVVSNRFPNVRAVVYYGGDKSILTLSREHNDANILSLGARFLSDDEAINAVKLWLTTAFSHGERHVRRIQKIDEAKE